MLVPCRDWLPKLARWSRPFPLDCQPAHANSGVALAKARCRTPHTVADASKLPRLGRNIGFVSLRPIQTHRRQLLRRLGESSTNCIDLRRLGASYRPRSTTSGIECRVVTVSKGRSDPELSVSAIATSDKGCGTSADSSRHLTVPTLEAFRELGFDTVKSVSGCAIEHHERRPAQRDKHVEHHNTGTRWRIYPMYAYAHPIEHALKNISSICTSSAGNHYPTGTPIVHVQRDVG